MKKLNIIIIFMLIFLLTGCVNGVFHVTVNKDGSGDLVYRLAVDPKLLSNNDKNEDNPLEEFKKLALQDGFIVSQFKENDYFGVEAKKHIADISDAIGGNLIQYASSSTSSEEINFTIDKGFLFNVYRLRTNMDLKNMIPEDTPFSSMILDKIDLKMLVTIPVEVINHNASRIEMGDTEDVITYEWQLLPGQNNEIYLEAKALNMTNVLILVLIALGGVAVTYFVFRKRNRTQVV